MAQLAPIAVQTIKETVEGTNTDRLRYESAIEIYNHNFGKPKQRTELTGEDGEALGAGMVTRLLEVIAQERRKLVITETPLLEEHNAVKQSQE